MKPKAIIPRVLKSQGKGHESLWTENQDKEDFAHFVTEMTKQCSHEIALKTKANIPYEIYQRYQTTQSANVFNKQDHCDKSTKQEKTITREENNSDPLVICHSNHFKRPRYTQNNESSLKTKRLRTDSHDTQETKENTSNSHSSIVLT